MHAVPDSFTARLAEVLRATAPTAPEEIRPEHALVGDLGYDSVALVKTVVALEEAFDVELPQERLHELRSATVGDVAVLLASAGAGA
jgi:acyl carrier protein